MATISGVTLPWVVSAYSPMSQTWVGQLHEHEYCQRRVRECQAQEIIHPFQACATDPLTVTGGDIVLSLALACSRLVVGGHDVCTDSSTQADGIAVFACPFPDFVITGSSSSVCSGGAT